MQKDGIIREELNDVLGEASRPKTALDRIELNRLTSAALWLLRVYVVVMSGLIGFKFLQMAGVMK